MDSDIPTQSIDKKSRSGYLHLAFAMDLEVAKEYAQGWQPEMTEKIDTHSVMEPGAPLMMGGGGPVLSASFAVECRRILRQALTEEENRASADFVSKAKVRESEATEQFKAFSPEKMGTQSQDSVDTRRALT